MLKHPKKNFGLLPSNETLAHLFIAVFICLIPSLFVIIQIIIGQEVTSQQMTGLVPRLLVLGLYCWLLYAIPGGWRTLWDVSRRRRYIQRVLTRHFRKRYGVKMVVHGDRADAVFMGRAIRLKGRKAPTDTLVFGWHNVEAIARGESLETPLEDNVYLVQMAQDSTAREIPLKDKDDSHRQVFVPRNANHPNPLPVPALNETEEGIKAMISNIIQSLPAGESTVRCIAPASSEMGVESEMRVTVDWDENLSYSLKEMHSLVESTLFNVRLSDSAMVICIVEASTGKKYICGHLVRNAGYSDVPADTLRSISNAEDLPDFIFVKNAKEMH